LLERALGGGLLQLVRFRCPDDAAYVPSWESSRPARITPGRSEDPEPTGPRSRTAPHSRLSYIATGNILGKNKREREAELEELLKDDAAYQQTVQDKKDSRNARALLDIENDHLQRQYRLAVTTIRAFAPD
jgi:hypothetical protein